MTTPKSDGMNKETIRLAEFAKALSHPARIRILEILAKRTLASAVKLWIFCPIPSPPYPSI